MIKWFFKLISFKEKILNNGFTTLTEQMKFVIFYTCIDLVYNPSKVSFSNFVLLSSNQLCTYKWCPLHLGNWVSGTQTCLRSSTLSLKIFKSLIQVLNGDFHAKKNIFFNRIYLWLSNLIKSFSAMQRSHNINNDQRKWIKTGKKKNQFIQVVKIKVIEL